MSWTRDHTRLFAAVFWEIGIVLTRFPAATHGYKASASPPRKALIKYMLIIILADAEGRLSVALR